MSRPSSKRPRKRLNVDRTEANSNDDVGYGRPPAHTRFEPGQSGNPRGRPKSFKQRDISKEIRNIFTRELRVRDGKRTRTISSIGALIQRMLADAINGDKKSISLCYKIAEDFGVFRLKDEVKIDLSALSAEERDICDKALEILRKTRILSRFDCQKEQAVEKSLAAWS